MLPKCVFRAKAGGLGLWVVDGLTIRDGSKTYRLSNDTLGFRVNMTGEQILECLE